MANPAEKTIGNTIYYITKMNAFAALPILGELQSELLPSAGGLIGAISGGEGEEFDESKLGDAIASFSKALDGKSLVKWAEKLLDPELVSYEKLDEHGDADGEVKKLTKVERDVACEDAIEMVELMAQILIVNFASPLKRLLNRTGLGDKLGQARK